MLAKLRSSTSPLNSPAAETNLTGGNNTTVQDRRASKLKKRKLFKSIHPLDKRASAPDLSSWSNLYPSISSSTTANPTPARDFSEPYVSSPVVEQVSVPKHLSLQPAKSVGYIDRHRHPSPAISLEETGSVEIPEESEKIISPSDGDAATFIQTQPSMQYTRNSECPGADARRHSTKLRKNPPTQPDSVKRRYSYTPPPQRKPLPETTLSEEDIKNLSITATRVPDFSSEAVNVTVVDHLPHQTFTPPTRTRTRPNTSRRHSSVPSTIIENDVNEEFLLDQLEVISYLQNSLFQPPSPAESPKALASDGGLPLTPPVAKPTFPKRQDTIMAKSTEFVDKMRSEFPYLLGNDDSTSIFETEPLKINDKFDNCGVGYVTSPVTSTLSHGTRSIFPPSPPQSEARTSSEHSLRAFDELGLESESMRSVVDAINRAVSSRSSFDYADSYDNESLYDTDEDVFQSADVPRPWTRQSDASFDGDGDSVYNFTSPILRTGRASFLGVEETNPVLSRSASQVSQSTTFEDSDIPIAEVLAEKRRSRPQLTPLVIAPIAPGQYGPPPRRRQHLRGKGKLSLAMSARGGFDAVKPTLVKVVEEEIVEYTPIEEGRKGWLRQRRVSRGGDWIVVEREILKQGTI